MRNSAKAALALLLFGTTAWIGVTVIWPAVSQKRKAAPKAPAAPALSAATIRALKTASGAEVRAALEEYWGRPEEDEVRSLAAARSDAGAHAFQVQLDGLLEQFRYASAVALIEATRREWSGLPPARLAATCLKEIREEQQEQVDGRKREADAMLEAGRHEAAIETLKTNWEFEAVYAEALRDYLAEVQHRIDYVPPSGGDRPPRPIHQQPPPVVRAGLSPPPALPGYPHPDVKRLGEARATIARARKLFSSGRHDAAAKAIDELIGYYGDLKYVKRNRDAAAAMMLLARYKARRTPAAFFRATSVKNKGRRVTLKYEFKSNGEFSDWIEERTLPYQTAGQFEPAREGVRGTGGMTYMLRGFFENDVKMSCRAKISKPKSHGLAFCQDDNELRQLVLLVTNHRIVEGENYVKARPGHSVLMFGKGTNNDVPIDSPDIGFIFKGASKTNPAPPRNATLTLTFAVKGDAMVGTVNYKGDACTLTYHTKGDDGRSIAKLRPAIFVIEAGVVFSEIVIKGTLHKDFEKRRVAELLDLIATLES